MGNNLPQAILNVGYEAYVDSEHVRFIHDRLFDETICVAAAYGIKVVYDENRHGRVRPEARFSTLQDIDAGRRTEIDMFAGVLMKKAAEAGIEVPYTPIPTMRSAPWRKKTRERSDREKKKGKGKKKKGKRREDYERSEKQFL